MIMKWFYDRKISTKLYLCFGFIGVVAMVIGWVAYNSTKRMAALADDMFSNQTAVIVQLANVRTAFIDMRMARRVAVTINDASERKQKIEKAGEHETRMREAMRVYASGGLSAEENAIVPRLQSELQEYYRLVHEADTFLVQMDDRKVLEIYNGTLPPVAAAITDDLDKLIAITESAASDRDQQNQALAESTTRQVIGYVVLGLLAAGLFGTFLARLIGNALKKLQAAAEKLAVGDIDVQVDIATADEIGALAGSFRTMAENIKQHAMAAQAIASGNVSVAVSCPSERDVLGKSLQGVHDWLKALVEYVTRIANGDMSARMQKSSDQDQIHGWLVLLKTNIVQLQSELGRLIAAAKDGDLVLRGDPEKFKGAYSELMTSVNEMFEVFRSTVQKVGKMSEPLSQASGELSRGAGNGFQRRTDSVTGEHGLGWFGAGEPQYSNRCHGRRRDGRQYSRDRQEHRRCDQGRNCGGTLGGRDQRHHRKAGTEQRRDRPGDQGHYIDCPADQPSCSERDHRGRARWRGRQGLRGGGK
jgi:methyl-accepting chemotaxis protein